MDLNLTYSELNRLVAMCEKDDKNDIHYRRFLYEVT